MSGIAGIITAINADLVSKIAGAGLPPLSDGAIVVGRVAANLTNSPPRVVFVPLSFRWAGMSPGHNSQPIALANPGAPGSGIRAIILSAQGIGYVPGSTVVTIGAPDVAGGVQATATAVVTLNTGGTGALTSVSITNAGSGYLKPPTVTISDAGGGTGASAVASLRQTPQALAVMTQRPIYTEWHKFEVHCWSTASSGNQLAPDTTLGSVLDYDATQQLMHQVIASTYAVAPGVHVLDAGKWEDGETNATLVDVVGHAAVFEMEIAVPVLLEPMVPQAGASIQFVPSTAKQVPTLNIQLPDGSSPQQGVP